VADKDGDADTRGVVQAVSRGSFNCGIIDPACKRLSRTGGVSRGAADWRVVEMQSALWVSVQMHGHLRGVLFAGGRKKHAAFARTLLESVAAELALVMELEDERRLGRERHRTPAACSAALASSESPSDLLAGIVKD